MDKISSLPPGRYEVRILAVTATNASTGKTIVTFEVLAGTVAGQEGRHYQEFFNEQFSAPSKALRKGV